MADTTTHDASVNKNGTDATIAIISADITTPALEEPFKNEKSDAPAQTALQKPVVQAQKDKDANTSNLVTPLERLGEVEAWIDCPHCEKRTKTKIEEHDSSQTNMAAALCCLCCGIITVCIPSLCHWCADIEHRCSDCGKPVAYKPHEGQTQPRYPQPPIQAYSNYAPMPAAQRKLLNLPPTQQPQPQQQQQPQPNQQLQYSQVPLQVPSRFQATTDS